MTYPVFQSLLVEHICTLLLLQRIFSEVPVLVLLYSTVDDLYGASLVLEDFFNRSRILPIT